ncbi:xyloglucan galactosyltransferase KATAMARI1 homolog [Miscanthus floridulus]|uniref:xyloglucan galactosyltransferase KATAMARI1 homolog n=1 Tax=Miscanthus floridulus TaxID=154761 RepID=UPI00345A7476
MKRHNASELPLSSSSQADDGRRLLATEEAEDKMDKYDKGRVRCSRLCFLFALAATVSILARHCYDAGLGRGDSAGVVRIEAVQHGLPPSVHRDRKIVPIARGGEPSESQRSTSAPVDAGDDASSKPSASRSDESANGGKTSSKQGSPSGAHAHTKQRGGHPFARALAAADDKDDLCGGQYIYVHELPARFNKDMVQNCDKLSPWTDMCRYTTNSGFGPLLRAGKGAFQGNGNGWYDTDEHALDIVFHERIKRYECLTDDPSLAAAVFVPFYAGLDVARHLWGNNVSARDELALDLASLLTKSPEWRAMGGRDHFFVAGRTTWDFRRKDDAHAEWGSRLLNLPAAKNMIALVVEASPWHLNDVAIPYPTSFHPASDEDLFFWQDRVRALNRSYLFSFAGVPRPGDAKSIEGHLVDQCKASDSCSLMECSTTGPDNKCESPASVMKLFQSSTFCLLPRGATDTRRHAFDAMLAGCIPVFFHPASAYVQYTWHLPKTHTDYSVYIPEDDVRKKNESVEERLRKIPPATVRAMRDAVVGLIPSVTYGDATSRLETTVKDAFDIAVAAVINKVTKLRRGIVEGRAEEEKLERYSWKYPLLAEGQKAEDHHEWDPLFN